MKNARLFCTFFIDDLLFGVDARQVQEVIRYQPLTRVPLADQIVRGLLNLRGHIVIAIDLRRRLDMPPRADGQPPVNVVLRLKGGLTSLLVDRVGDVLKVDEDAFEKPPETLQGIAREMVTGVYKLPAHLLVALDTERAANVEHFVTQSPELSGKGAGR